MLKTHYSHKLNSIFIILALLFLFIPQLPNNIPSSNEFKANKPQINDITSSSTLRVGIGTKPVFYDPVDVWDPASLNVLDQVAEGLFSYNLSDPGLQKLPMLAEDLGTWSGDAKNYTLDLRQGVTFHDGTPFNATAVKFTFDRLLYWTNGTGLIMDIDDLAITTELFKWSNGTHILNRIEIIDTYTVRFVLNHVYQLFEQLLTFSACYIISPTSHAITEKIGPGETHEFPIGTGPFICENWVIDELVFSRNEDYWQGPSEIKSLIFWYREDANSRNIALIAEDIQFLVDPLPELMQLFNTMERVTLLDSDTMGLETYCIGMNNKMINATYGDPIKEAISYAFNYTYVIEQILLGNAERLKSPIPNGMIFANETNYYPTYNITKARLIMQSMGYGVGFDLYNATDWIAVANGPTPFLNLNYSYNVDNLIGGIIGLLLMDNLELIGGKITLNGMSYHNFIKQLYGVPPYSKDDLGLFFHHWMPYYLDPSNYINPLYDPRFKTHSINSWGSPYLNYLMDEGIKTQNVIERKNIYDEIQQLIIEQKFPMIYMYTPEIIYAHHSNLTGFQPNVLNKLIFYPCRWELEPVTFNLSSTADYPDTDGSFILNWTESENAMNYSVYQYHSFITEINGSLIPLLLETEDLFFPISGLANGDHYFIVEAHNIYGNTLSNCISVSVQVPPGPFTLYSDTGPIDDDGNFNLNWTGSVYVDNYSVFQYSQFITEINGSLIPLLLETGDLSLPISGLTSGDYYFIVEAHNIYGNTLSNCLKVSVQIPPGPITLYSDTGPIDDDGNFNLNWTGSVYVDNYSVFQYSQFITEINWSLTPLILETEDLSFPISGLTSGDYYFIVEAHNIYGNNISNCLKVSVQIPPGPFTLYSDTGTSDDDGSFNLNWDSSVYADNYSVYQYSDFITEINGSITPLILETEDLTFPISILTNDEYYFIVEAHNVYGNTLSNCLKVSVQIPPGPLNLWSDADSPDEDGIFSLSWNSSSNALSYSVYQYDSFITEINGSLIPLIEDIQVHLLSLAGYQDGDYYFIAVAHNDYGDTLSNCIEVVVSTPKIEQPIPGYNLFFIIFAVNIALIAWYKKKFKNQVKR